MFGSVVYLEPSFPHSTVYKLQSISDRDFNEATLMMHTAATSRQYSLLHPLLRRLLCTAVTSTPVERIFPEWNHHVPTQVKNE